MKRLTLLTAVAVSCCTLSSSYGQIQLMGPHTPTPAPRLVSEQDVVAEIAPLPTLNPDSFNVLPNPFDYFDLQDAAQGVALEASPSDLSSDGSTTSIQPGANDPASLPGARTERPQLTSIVDTLVTQAALAKVPHVGQVPIYWGGAPQTPNPVAQWLKRQQCVDGLWANYPAQRAAECVRMWSHLSGHGYGASGSGPCQSCAGHADYSLKPRNRFLERLTAAPTTGCATCGTACDAHPAQAESAPACTSCAQAAPATKTAQAGEPSNLAALPGLTTSR